MKNTTLTTYFGIRFFAAAEYRRRAVALFVGLFVVGLPMIALAVQVDVFFVGGQSNAKTQFRDGVQSALAASGLFPNLQVVWTNHSGEAISNWYNSGRQANYLTDLYDPSAAKGLLEDACNNIVAAGDTYRIRGFFWFQGETDRLYSTTYAAKFNGLLNQLAADLNHGVPVPFAITLIAYNPNVSPSPLTPEEEDGVMALRVVQQAIATNSPVGSYADSWGYPRGDIWHILITDGPPDSLSGFGSDLAHAYLAGLPASSTWTNLAGGSWTTAGNWTGASADGPEKTADFSTLDLTADATVTLDGARTIGNLTFGDTTPSDNWILNTGTGGPLTLDGDGGDSMITVINQTATIGLVLAGTNPVVKDGAGTLHLSNTNTYSGTTVLKAGVLQAADGTGLPTASYLSFNGGVLETSGTFTRALGTNRNTVGWVSQTTGGLGGGFAAKGGVLYLKFNNSTATAVSFSSVGGANISGTLQFGSATADNKFVFQNPLSLNGAERTINVTAGTGGADATSAEITGVIAGATSTGRLKMTGDGVLILSGANTWENYTILGGGVLVANHAQNGTTSGPLGTNGQIIFRGGTLRFTAASAGWDPSARIAAATSTGAVSIDTSGQNITFATGLTVSQSGGVAKLGAGRLTLNAANAFAGNTTISAGTLALGSGGMIADTARIAIASGATFDVSAPAAGFTFTGDSPVQTLTGSSPSGTANITATAKTVTLNSGARLSFQADGAGSTVGKIHVAGNLTLNANAISVNITGPALSAGDYPLLDCTGTLANTGTFATPLITGTPLPGTAASIIVNPGSAGSIVLHVAPTSVDLTKVIIIKADDFRGPDQTWTDFLQVTRAEGIKVGLGAIVNGIVGNTATIQWMQQQQALGDVEFWDHGWDHFSGEFSGSGLAYMQQHIDLAQTGLSNALGRSAIAFGPTGNAFDTNTLTVINTTVALRLFFTYGVDTNLLDPHVATMGIIPESDGTALPNAAKFAASYPAGPRGPVALQFHPPYFDAAHLLEFQKIVQFLKTNGYTFLLPAEYIATLANPPVAGFSAAPATGGAPLAVTFTDTTTGTFSQRVWSFGDGATTNAPGTNLVHTYRFPGTNTVQLIITGPSGVSTNTQTNLIIATAVDTIGDSIPNWWRAQYFGGTGATTDGSSCATCDVSGTGQDNLFKYRADLDPTNAASRLAIIRIAPTNTDVALTWIGGTNAWQYLECSSSLASNQWVAIFTNIPPTPLTNAIIHTGATATTNLFYRLKAGR